MPPTTTATPCYSSRHFAILRTLLNAHLDDYRAVWFATSPYVQPQTLLWFRIVITVYTVIITFINIFIRHPEMWQWWSAMTHISWIGVFLYFFSASIHTHYYIQRLNRDIVSSLDNVHIILKWLLWNLYIMAATLQWIVVLVWWSLLSASDLSSGDGYNLFMDANVHTLGLILMLVEGALNWIPIFPSQWVAPIGAGLLYAAYAQVQHLLFSQYVSNRSFWEYSFLDTTAKYAGLWYCGFVLGFFLIFFVVVGLHLVRDRVFRKGKSPDQPEEVTKEDNSFGGNNNNGSSSIETLRV